MTRSSHDRTTEELSKIPTLEALVGVFVELDGVWAIVNQGDTTIRARSVSAYAPFPGESVRLERRGGELVMLGPTVARPSVGKILTAGTPRSLVEYPPGSGVSRQMIVNLDYAPIIGDFVQLSWDGSGGVVVCALAEDPTAAPPDPNGPTTPTEQHPSPFTASESGSVRVTTGAWWTTSVRAGDPTTGSWFYGPKIKDTIPDSAVIISARLFLPQPTVDEGFATYLGVHSAATKPGSGSLTITGSYLLPAHAGWVAIPTSFIDTLKTTDGGLGLVPGLGYTWWPGVDSDGLSGALDIVYLG